MAALIFGSSGQLGHALAQRLPQAQTFERRQCDVTIPQDVHKAMTDHAPTVLFNATAYNGVDAAEENRDAAFAVNAVAAGRLAAAASRTSAKFVHFSTDYVFGNGHVRPIDEAATPDPLSVYGASKLHGERLAVQNNPQTYVVRTTGLYSHRRSNFVKTMIRCAVQGKKVEVVNDQFVSPTWVESLATVVTKLVVHDDVFGVYHITSQGSCSWYELAGRIFEILDLDAELHATDQESWGAAARRPAFSELDDAMLRALELPRIGRWDDELEAFLRQHGTALVDEASAT